METIRQITDKLKNAPSEELPVLVQAYADDVRAGVQAALQRARNRLAAEQAEDERLQRMLTFERQYAAYGPVCGIDEAGRGPLAGPVVAAAVILPEGTVIRGCNDSKQLSPKKRDELFDEIREKALSFGIGIVDNVRIDEINILQADYEAMREAVRQLDPQPAVLLNDAVTIPGLSMRQVNLVHGDARSLSIAAASILAKVTRDRLMEEMDETYPGYGFAGHKGYGSAAHIEALRRLGPCPIHRRTFIGHFVNID